MIEILKKGMSLGMGFIAFTKEKAETLVDELIKRGETDQAARSRTVDELLRRANEFEREVEQKIQTQVEATLQKLGIPTKKDLEELRREMKALSEKTGK